MVRMHTKLIPSQKKKNMLIQDNPLYLALDTLHGLIRETDGPVVGC